MSLILERTNAVREAIARIKAAELGDDNHDDAQIEAGRAALLALAARTELFPVAQFPYLYAQRSGFYRLAEDADHRNALYVQVSTNEHGGNSPHQHPYWAIIAGVRGNEHNVLYRRTDDGQVEGRGQLGKVGEVSVVPSKALYIPHDTYHTIGTRGGEVGIHLHFYRIGTDTPEHRGAPRFASPESDVVVARAGTIDPGEIGVQRVWLRDVQAGDASGNPLSVLQAGTIETPLPEPLRGRADRSRRWGTGRTAGGQCNSDRAGRPRPRRTDRCDETGPTRVCAYVLVRSRAAFQPRGCRLGRAPRRYPGSRR